MIVGQIAQTVTPNPKCESCLHYNAQRGASGVCEIGLRPIVCGDGTMPDMGYAPVSAIGPSIGGTHAPNGQAPIQSGKNLIPDSALYNRGGNGGGEAQIVAMQVVALNEEHVDMVKSLDRQLAFTCRNHERSSSSRPAVAALHNQNDCTCKSASTRHVARALVKTLTNRVRNTLGDRIEDYTESFVRAVRSGQSMDSLHKSLGATAVLKGYYGQEWLDQFKHTDLFDDAIALCEEELAVAEEQLKRRQDNAKQRLAREAALAKLPPEKYDSYDFSYTKEEAIRLKKQKLQLKLAKHQQKQISGATVSKAWGNTAAPVTEIKKPHGSYAITSKKNNHTVSYKGNGMQPKSIAAKKTLDAAKDAVESHHTERTAMLRTPIR